MLINHLQTVMSGSSAALVGGNKLRFPSLKAISNFRTALPADTRVSTMSAFRRISENAGVEYATFYDYDEALSWLKDQIKS